MKRLGVVGAGAWGTALAHTACRSGLEVCLWAHEPETAAAINEAHENKPFLPGLPLDPALQATTDLARVCDADAVLLTTPAQVLRTVCQNLAPHWTAGVPAVICSKGIETATGALMTQVVTESLLHAPIAVLSGPSFAGEVARGLPTAVTLACADEALGQTIAEALGNPAFRTYWSTDVIGAQLGGSVKNVLAIACGIVEGRGMGDNARAALVTRGLAEMSRLAVALGARPETLMGLSGLGDLVLTANAMQSRNFSFGVQLGQGQTVQQILDSRTAVTEGVHTAAAVAALAEQLAIDLPICQAADAVLNRGADLNATITALLSRPLTKE
ncbi:NAD(P)H-dependent glycerol-3-phosphate dehydrogenase [Magnetospira sp. QH-2]|uniref:NAD(P)H-dependent glycerol-3-phosphate dehydrogenase n=1 Tax=Magnetospira sp. (strain QH-2) TaxID=1288970 RepID=UPI0003E8161B|nr:NAD(P)H-dependent glycerol-3-phosphate dehydrogenase [Magnetospira sp. QH-2]CCQ75378.1 glycerol-3-phosphate dehydrogenase (NAD+) [Magnetospira sp. QH-2]